VLIAAFIGAFIGLGGGIYFVMQDAIFADVLDENVVLDGERREGTYFGVKFFLGRFAGVFQSFVLAFIHVTTGFNPEVEEQTPLALLGIRMHLALIPAVALLLGAIIFYKWYDLTPDKIKSIRAELIESKL
ncbi:MAG: MFS transporter, partial [Promethearchaeota archaeon]